MNGQFSESQWNAIRHHSGPCLVLAGPGSGKTLVITNRTRYLIEHYGINPSNILVITFTKAAAKEMQERFEGLMEGQRPPVSFGTFHAVFFKILKYAYNYSAENILREDEKYRMIRELTEQEELDIEDINEFVSSIIGEISAVKGDMIDISHYYSCNCSDEAFRRIYRKYDDRLRKSNKVDFDDMLVMCYELLRARKDILAAWQNKYRYILIDEFQDINRVQFEIMKLLALPENNLFVVGDDDQSIYRFRGARPEIMLNFEKEYPGTIQVVLNENYRSSGNIVTASLRLVQNNKNRFRKVIKPVAGKGFPVIYRKFPTQTEENQQIVEEIKSYIESGGQYSDIAILFRTNIGPRFLVDKLMEYNLPFHMKDAMPNLYEHFIAKNLFAYINIACGSRKRSDYLQIINRPKRYISREALSAEELSISMLKEFYSDKDWMIERLERLEYDLTLISRMTPYAAITYIRQGIGYDGYLGEYAEYRRMKPEELTEVINEIAEAAKPYRTFSDWYTHIQEYSEELIRQARISQRQPNAVELATMHSSKGLEYDTVFIIDAVEGVTPHAKAVLEEDLEEERRMFYVAVTRAKRRLYIYSTEERFNKPVSVSRFAAEMQIDLEGITVGGAVVHKKYGEGIIRRMEEGKIVIYFGKLRKELVFDMKYAFSNNIIQNIEV